jgi:hypothetical protein
MAQAFGLAAFACLDIDFDGPFQLIRPAVDVSNGISNLFA